MRLEKARLNALNSSRRTQNTLYASLLVGDPNQTTVTLTGVKI